MTDGFRAALWWRREQEKIRCLLCPHCCLLEPGETGKCSARRHERERGLVTLNYGRVSSAAVDPIEKKPLYHWNPGTSILSLGTVGCSMDCPFCQNWRIAGWDPALSLASMDPEDVVRSAAKMESRAVAFTYNEPFVWFEFLLDASRALRKAGLSTVLVSNGMVLPEPLGELLPFVSAANIDLKAFTEDFYFRQTGAHLAPVLDTLQYVKHETGCWLELTTLLIPGQNDDSAELDAMTRWIADHLGTDVPLHFTAFHPDYKMTGVPRTPSTTLTRARRIAQENGLAHVYTGNVHDREGGTTFCSGCQAALIERDWHQVLRYDLDADGACVHCGTRLAGRFGPAPGGFGGRRVPVRISAR